MLTSGLVPEAISVRREFVSAEVMALSPAEGGIEHAYEPHICPCPEIVRIVLIERVKSARRD